ncbi:MAG TPA: hypothetical protein VJN93_03075 [Candidatus Acidoferrum sp.]|nr:hypothetical protein [Candidatus Acidoferrum sp.]
MSNYTTLGEDQPYEWNIVPLSIYLYGVEDPRNRPLLGTEKIKRLLEERYRENYLGPYCASSECRTSMKAEWREMVGATFERSMYAFILATTVEQDRAFIAEFNGLPNRNHFNGITRNCAEFTRRVLNLYFPHSTKPDYLNDFGLITPKAIARSFAHYGEHHPEAQFHVAHFAQMPGTFKRSSECRNGTEQFYRSKKLLVPMLIFADHELPFMAATYLLTARFSPEHELERHPSPEASELQEELHEARRKNDVAREQRLELDVNRESAALVGTAREWKEYREEVESLTKEAVAREFIPDANFLGRLFKFLDRNGTPSIDADGSVWIELKSGGKPARIGLSADNLLAAGSDSQWSYALMLARAAYYLKIPKHSREVMPQFSTDWTMLEASRKGALSTGIIATATNTSLVPPTVARPSSVTAVQEP